MLKYFLIAACGGAGSALRYWVHTGVQRIWGSAFPWGTLVINVLGCLLIGGFAALFLAHSQIREEYRLAITVGILGGFTTFSTFGFESFKLIEQGKLGLALLNMTASCALGLLAVAIGYWTVNRLA
jgi:fluoride exporter